MTNNAKRLLFLFVFLVCSDVILLAQSPCRVERQELEKHIYTLASDSLAGRMTGEFGQKMAAGYIADHFRQIGLSPFISDTGYFQYFTLYETIQAQVMFGGIRTEVPVIAISEGYGEFADTCIFLFGHKRISVDRDRLEGDNALLLIRTRNIRQARNLIRHHYRQGVRRFAMVTDGPYWSYHLMNYTMPQRRYRLTRTSDEKRVDKIVRGLDSVFVVMLKPGEIARVIGFRPDFEMLEQESARHGTMVQVGSKIFYEHQPLQVKEVVTENVVGLMKGARGLDEVVILTAHYDHVGVDSKGVNVGADDNASGTAALIESARILQCRKDTGAVYERSVLFVAFSAEEVGLLGSEYFVASDDFARVKPLVNLNMDMIGRSVRYGMWEALMLQSGGGGHKEDMNQREPYVYLLNRGKSTRKYVQYARQSAKAMSEEFTIDRSPGSMTKLTFRKSSDHANFLDKGIPALVWFTGLHPDYHTPHDTPDKIDYDNMLRITRVLIGTIDLILNQ